MELNLNIYETMALVSIVFYLGRYTRNRFSILSKYCVPPAVVGGFIFALFILLLHETNLATINLDMSLQNLFMTAFFTSIGFTASFKIWSCCITSHFTKYNRCHTNFTLQFKSFTRSLYGIHSYDWWTWDSWIIWTDA